MTGLPLPATAQGKHVAIIGAGPAGLSLAYELQRRRITSVVLEQGPSVGYSWRSMPENLKLISPWKANYLPGGRHKVWPKHRQVTRAEFAQYLEDYAREHSLPVRTATAVTDIERPPELGFRIVTTGGCVTTRCLVNATGYFSNPVYPSIPGVADSPVAQLHFAHFQNADQIQGLCGNSGGPVLIVGHRLSAGQAMLELARAGFEVALSHRAPLKFGTGQLGWWIIYRTFPWFEWLQLLTNPAFKRSTAVPMQGGATQQLIASGQVKTFPAISHFSGRHVTFVDGTVLTPAVVLYATGFRPALKHLAGLPLSLHPNTGLPQLKDFESVSVPDLFFLGLDNTRNFQSRFLRGIRKDVGVLADILSRRVAHRIDGGS